VALGQLLSIHGLVVSTTPGRAFVATIDDRPQPGRDRVDILDSADGVLQRSVTVGEGMPTIAFDRQGDRVFVADTGLGVAGPSPPVTGILRALDGESGAQLRAVSFGTQPTAIAVDGQAGRVFVVGGGSGGCAGATCWRDPDVLRLFDARTLQLLRTVPLDSDPQDVTTDERSGRVFVTFLSGIWLLDARTGRVVRKVTGVRRVLAIDARTKRAFVTRVGGGVEMLDAATGRDLGPVAVGAGSEIADGMPAAVDAASNRVFILDTGRGTATGARSPGAVSVVDGASGRLVHTIPLGRVGTSPAAIALAPERHQAFVADSVANTVSVLDTRRWRVQRVIRAGSAPTALIWDARTGHLVVESINTPGSNRPDAWAWLPPLLRSWLPLIPRQRVAPAGASITVVDPAR
jgi:DNA-binding beta-propeller fold protein YncE